MNRQFTKVRQDLVAEAWRQYFASGRSTVSRNFIVEMYRCVAEIVATNIHRRMPNEVDLDDLISDGVIGLMEAIEKFDPGRGVQFGTYAVKRIRGAILDGIRGRDWVPRLARTHGSQMARARMRLFQRLKRQPTRSELQGEMGLSDVVMARYENDEAVRTVSSLSTTFVNQDGRDVIAEETLASPKSEEGTTAVDGRDAFEQIIRPLTTTQRLIFRLYYIDDVTMKQIGGAIGLSESRVCQLMIVGINLIKSDIAAPKSTESQC
jgi:RNA polymerase sigma factor for flagellar operon FliA